LVLYVEVNYITLIRWLWCIECFLTDIFVYEYDFKQNLQLNTIYCSNIC